MMMRPAVKSPMNSMSAVVTSILIFRPSPVSYTRNPLDSRPMAVRNPGPRHYRNFPRATDSAAVTMKPLRLPPWACTQAPISRSMFRRGIQDRITHALIFDEAHRAAGLKLIPTMAKECRKYGISLVLASQEARDFNVSLFSAIANYLVLRLTEADAKSLVRNVASSQHERTLMDKIKQMARFKALYFCEGRSKPYSVNLSS